jgi:hypothetical protein
VTALGRQWARSLLRCTHERPALSLFRFQVGRLWHRVLSRRSQNGRVLWDRMRRFIGGYLPLPASATPIRCGALASSPEAGAGCEKSARPDLWRGLWATTIPTPTRVVAVQHDPREPEVNQPGCQGRAQRAGGLALKGLHSAVGGTPTNKGPIDDFSW